MGSNIANYFTETTGKKRVGPKFTYSLGGTSRQGGLISGSYTNPVKTLLEASHDELNGFGSASNDVAGVLGMVGAGLQGVKGGAAGPTKSDSGTFPLNNFKDNPAASQWNLPGSSNEKAVNDMLKGVQPETMKVDPAQMSPIITPSDPAAAGLIDGVAIDLTTPTMAGPGAPGLRKGGKNKIGSVEVEAEGGERKIKYDEKFNAISDDPIIGRSHEQGGKDIVLEPNTAVLNKEQYAMYKSGTPLKVILDGLKNVHEEQKAKDGMINQSSDPEPFILFDTRRAGKWAVNADIKNKFAGNKKAYYDDLRKRYNIVTTKKTNIPILKDPISLPEFKRTVEPGSDVEGMIANKHARDFFSGRTSTIFPVDPPAFNVPKEATFEDNQTGLISSTSGTRPFDLQRIGNNTPDKDAPTPLIVDPIDTTGPEKKNLFDSNNMTLAANTLANLAAAFQEKPHLQEVAAPIISEPTFVTPHNQSPDAYLKETSKQSGAYLRMLRESGRTEMIPSVANAMNEQVGKITEAVAEENVKGEVQAQSQNAAASNQIKQTNAGLISDSMKTNAALRTDYENKRQAVNNERVKGMANVIQGFGNWDKAKKDDEIKKQMMARIMAMYS